MLLSATLNIIADNCNKRFQIPSHNANDFINLISFIEKEISEDDFTRTDNYNSFLIAINRELKETIGSKQKLIENEIGAIKRLIGKTFYKVLDGHKIYKTIYDCILINWDKIRIFKHFRYNYYKQEIDKLEIFVRIVYSYEIIKYLCFLEGEPLRNLPILLNETPSTNTAPLTFKDLFEPLFSTVEKINEFKELLKNNGYINDNNIWEGETGNKNELAHLYYYLKSCPGIIKSGEFAPQIIAFYKEFGKVVYKDSKDKGENGNCTIKGLRSAKHKDTTKDFTRLFSNWVK